MGTPIPLLPLPPLWGERLESELEGCYWDAGQTWKCSGDKSWKSRLIPSVPSCGPFSCNEHVRLSGGQKSILFLLVA